MRDEIPDEDQVHVWPHAEAQRHTLVGYDCPCHPQIDQTQGELPLVNHCAEPGYRGGWCIGRTNRDHPADFSISCRCMECGNEEHVHVVSPTGEAIPPLCIEEENWLGECAECGIIALVPEWELYDDA